MDALVHVVDESVNMCRQRPQLASYRLCMCLSTSSTSLSACVVNGLTRRHIHCGRACRRRRRAYQQFNTCCQWPQSATYRQCMHVSTLLTSLSTCDINSLNRRHIHCGHACPHHRRACQCVTSKASIGGVYIVDALVHIVDELVNMCRQRPQLAPYRSWTCMSTPSTSLSTCAINSLNRRRIRRGHACPCCERACQHVLSMASTSIV